MSSHLMVLTPSISRLAGGLYYSVRQLSQSVLSHGQYQVTVDSLHDQYAESDGPNWSPLALNVFKTSGPSSFKYSRELYNHVNDTDANLIHLHGLWTHLSILSSEWTRRTSRPHVVSPRGMLDPWALRNSGWKKRIASFAFERTNLRTAKCIHALNTSEYDSIRKFGLPTPVAVVPNGVELPDRIIRPERLNGQTKHLLFMSRIHPKKGLAELLHAWKQLVSREINNGDWKLVIAGWDQGGHLADLLNQCRLLGLTFRQTDLASWLQEMESSSSYSTKQSKLERESIVFVGPAIGKEKEQLLSRVDAFILPSFSEGLPMAVLEAWAYGLPVVMTPECNLPEGFTSFAAIEIAIANSGREQNRLYLWEGIANLMRMSPEARIKMGVNGRSLVESRFSWKHISEMMQDVYDWTVNNGRKPAFVHMD